MGLIISPTQEGYAFMFEAYQAMGSAIKGQMVGSDLIFSSGTATTLSNQVVRFQPIWIPYGQTLTGVMFYQAVQGSYTANNNNKIGLYSYSAGTLTQVASCADDGNLWKGASNSFQTKAFSATYDAERGLYFTAMIYCRSAEVTAPQLGSGSTVSNAAKMTQDFTNSTKAFSSLAAQTNLPSPSQAMSGLSASTVTLWMPVY